MDGDTHSGHGSLFTCRLPPPSLLFLPSLALPDTNYKTQRETHTSTQNLHKIYINAYTNTSCYYDNRKEQNLLETKVAESRKYTF